MQEQRKTWRINLILNCKIIIDDYGYPASIEDVGGGGIRFISEFEFNEGEIVNLLFPDYSKTRKFKINVIESNSTGKTHNYRTRGNFIEITTRDSDNLLNFLLRKLSK